MRRDDNSGCGALPRMIPEFFLLPGGVALSRQRRNFIPEDLTQVKSEIQMWFYIGIEFRPDQARILVGVAK